MRQSRTETSPGTKEVSTWEPKERGATRPDTTFTPADAMVGLEAVRLSDLPDGRF